jgi:hypothetical protein
MPQDYHIGFLLCSEEADHNPKAESGPLEIAESFKSIFKM